MPETIVPSLSGKGFLTEPYDKADELMSNFFKTKDSQSIIYKGQLTSLAALIQKATGKPDLLISSVNAAIQTMFNRHFDSSIVSVKIVDNNDSNDNRFDLQVSIEFTQQGKPYNIGRLASVVDSKLVETMELAL